MCFTSIILSQLTWRDHSFLCPINIISTQRLSQSPWAWGDQVVQGGEAGHVQPLAPSPSPSRSISVPSSTNFLLLFKQRTALCWLVQVRHALYFSTMHDQSCSSQNSNADCIHITHISSNVSIWMFIIVSLIFISLQYSWLYHFIFWCFIVDLHATCFIVFNYIAL